MRIAALNIYPIKGCRAVPLAVTAVDRLGLVGDRRLMLVDTSNRFISQREIPELATIEPAWDNGNLAARAPRRAALHVAIDPHGPIRQVRVWADHDIRASDQGEEAARWFSAVIGAPCRLVYFGPGARNPIDPAYASRADAETAFTDGYPILAVLRESLDELNTRLASPVRMERFRPSVVLSGAPAWSEDAWRTIILGDLACDVVKPCARCVVITTDQVTGARDEQQEPLRALAAFRTAPGLGAIFGQNVIPRETGMLRVGDKVQVS